MKRKLDSLCQVLKSTDKCTSKVLYFLNLNIDLTIVISSTSKISYEPTWSENIILYELLSNNIIIMENRYHINNIYAIFKTNSYEKITFPTSNLLFYW